MKKLYTILVLLILFMSPFILAHEDQSDPDHHESSSNLSVFLDFLLLQKLPLILLSISVIALIIFIIIITKSRTKSRI